MRTMFKIILCTTVISLWLSAQAEIKLPEIFNNHMVLQREVKVPVWGTAAPREKVSVKFNGQEVSTQADNSGNWKVELAPMKAGGPFKMEVKGNNVIIFNDVMVGEVWLCSGQSNMEWTVRNSNNSLEEIANAKHPNIRLFHVKKVWKTTPQKSMQLTSTWRACTPQTITKFSATGYYFGRELNKKLNIPIGLINSSWGGTRIESWTPPVGFSKIPALKDINNLVQAKLPGTALNKQMSEQAINNYSKWIAQAKINLANKKELTIPPAFPRLLTPYISQRQPTVLYNAMINPIVPYAIRGAIWYQGESNRVDGSIYKEKMQALIEGWRNVWNIKNMPFYFVQLAPFKYGGNRPDLLPVIWEAQAEVAQTVPNTGMAVITDIGNIRDIHPRNKQDVGKRLAMLALNKTYGMKDIACDSPVFKELKIENNAMRVTFSNAKYLKTRDGKAPNWFMICASNAIFKRADAKIDGNSVILTAEGIDNPCAVRFAWNQLAEPNLQNESGLQASAFRAGTLPGDERLLKFTPKVAGYKVVYSFDPAKLQLQAGRKTVYTEDKSSSISGNIVKVGYFLLLNGKDYVFTSMNAFTQDLKKIGVPDKDSGARFQQKVRNLFVASNVKGVKVGSFKEGNIEFWDCNYAPSNKAKIPGAHIGKYDFGDQISTSNSPGYGSMQVHNFMAKQTVFAFNNFKAGNQADLGIGNSPAGHPDWTYSRGATKYKSAKMYVMVKTK